MRYVDPRASMWAEACEMLEQAERLQRQFFRPARPGWEPPADVFENAEDLSIVIALPGVAPDNVKILVEGGTVTVTGVRPLPGESRDGVIHRVEIPHGRFERRFTLPGGRFELRQRDLRDGCLTLKLRKLG
jgi:HSP20 family molecular chaperone IbpA